MNQTPDQDNTFTYFGHFEGECCYNRSVAYKLPLIWEVYDNQAHGAIGFWRNPEGRDTLYAYRWRCRPAITAGNVANRRALQDALDHAAAELRGVTDQRDLLAKELETARLALRRVEAQRDTLAKESLRRALGIVFAAIEARALAACLTPVQKLTLWECAESLTRDATPAAPPAKCAIEWECVCVNGQWIPFKTPETKLAVSDPQAWARRWCA